MTMKKFILIASCALLIPSTAASYGGGCDERCQRHHAAEKERNYLMNKNRCERIKFVLEGGAPRYVHGFGCLTHEQYLRYLTLKKREAAQEGESHE